MQRLVIFARHAESAANVAHAVSSDPSRSVQLTPLGRAEAARLGAQLVNLEIDLAVCSRFLRTRQTVDIALRGRDVPVLVEPDLDEVNAGDLDGRPIDAYGAWKEHHTSRERFPHGESLDEACGRYAAALRRLVTRTEPVTLVVAHEFGLRHIVAAATSHPSRARETEVLNALPYLFDAPALERAAARLESWLRSTAGNARDE